jgi:hypothetical protein
LRIGCELPGLLGDITEDVQGLMNSSQNPWGAIAKGIAPAIGDLTQYVPLFRPTDPGALLFQPLPLLTS